MKRILQEHKEIIILAAVLLGVYAYFIFTTYYIPFWDDAVYVGMGKYLYSGGANGLLEAIRPIGLPLITGFFWKMHMDYITWSRVILALMAVATSIVVYLIGSELYDKKTGLVAAFLVSITPVFFYQSLRIMTEVPSALFVLLGAYAYIKKKYFWAGVASAIAFAFRFPTGIIIAGIILSILIEHVITFFRSKKRSESRIVVSQCIKILFLTGIGFAVIVAPMLIYNYYIYHSHSQTAIGAMLLPMSLAQEHANNLFESVIDGSLGSYIYNVLFYIAVILRDNAIYLLFIITIIAEWKSFVENRNLRFIVITLILFTAYFTYIINKQDRFIIAFIGLMSILASRTLVKYYDKIKEYYSTEKKKKAKKTNASKNLATYYILSIILVAGVITTFIALNSCISFYSWYSPSNSAPSVVSFYKYFDGKNITGPLLVTNPVITAYSDIRFIPYYDVVSNMAYVNPWEMGDNINGAVYVSGSTPCEENDTACKDKNDRFYNYLRSDFKLVYKTTFDNNDYQIFLNKE